MEVVKWVFVGIFVVGTLYACYVINKNAPKQDVHHKDCSPSDPSSDSLPWVQKRESASGLDKPVEEASTADDNVALVVKAIKTCFAEGFDKEAIADCVKLAHRSGKGISLYFSKGCNAEQVANLLMRHVLFSYVCCGEFHMYRGLLGLRGESLRLQFIGLTHEAVKKRWISAETMKQDIDALEQGIKEVG